MPNPNAVVSTVVRLELPLVELENGRQVRLEPDDRRSAGLARVLEGLSKERLPVYLEVDPETSAITRLLIPYVARVLGIRSGDDDALNVEIMPSHARHVLRRDAPDFEELERRLRNSMGTGETVVLTEDDAHEIIDVRPYTGPEGPPGPFPEPKPGPRLPSPWLRYVQRIWWWPCHSRKLVSLSVAISRCRVASGMKSRPPVW